jgi:anti-sigma factor RsiW
MTDGRMWDESMLSGLIDSQLSEAERQQAIEQLATNPQLQELHDDLKNLSAQLRHLPAASLQRDLSAEIMSSIASSSRPRPSRNGYWRWGLPLVAAASLLVGLLVGPTWLEKQRLSQSDEVALRNESAPEPDAFPAAAAPQRILREGHHAAAQAEAAARPPESVQRWVSDPLAATWQQRQQQRQLSGEQAPETTQPILVVRAEASLPAGDPLDRTLPGHAPLDDTLGYPNPAWVSGQEIALRSLAEPSTSPATSAAAELAAASPPQSRPGFRNRIGGGMNPADRSAAAGRVANGTLDDAKLDDAKLADATVAGSMVADATAAQAAMSEPTAAEGAVAVLTLYSELAKTLEALRTERWLSGEQAESIIAQAVQQWHEMTATPTQDHPLELVDPWVWIWLEPSPGAVLEGD